MSKLLKSFNLQKRVKYCVDTKSTDKMKGFHLICAKSILFIKRIRVCVLYKSMV